MSKIKVNYTDSLAYYKIAYFLKNHINDKTIIVCIGTDRCIGDSLGPLVGTYLKNDNFPLPVYGTIQNPIHALNLAENLNLITSLHQDANIIGIDACLGEINSIGELQARDYPIHPGKGVGKLLPDVGSISIIGIVDTNDSDELFANRNIRLNLIMKMAAIIKKALIHGYYLHLEDCF